MSDRYYVVELINGRVLDFNKKCDRVLYNDDNYTIFRQTTNPTNQTYRCLALIPHRSIRMITAHNKED